MTNFSSWRSYWNFRGAVKGKERFIHSKDVETFLQTVLDTGAKRRVDVPKDTIWWRAQLGHDWRSANDAFPEAEIECAYPRTRMKPLQDSASDGRANPRDIPALYLATEKETAIAEVRPWMGSYVSVAQFKTQRELKVINFSKDEGHPIFFKEPTPVEREEAVWKHICQAFSEPMTKSDNYIDYVPTQIIAELFKANGYDGVAYRSNFGTDGFNIALFDLEAAALINCGLHRVDGIKLKTTQQDNPYSMKEE